MKLRPYQTQAIEEIQKKFKEGKKYIMLVLQMGLGKTVVASRMIQMAVQNNKRVLFIAHRTFLITQCRDKLLKFGVPAGIIKAGFKEDRTQRVQIASIQTLSKRNLPEADFIMIDECHHATAKEYLKVINHYKEKGAWITGLTATPFPSSKKIGMKAVFDDYVRTIDVQEAIESGYILPSKVFMAGSVIDTSKITKNKGDFDEKSMFKAVDIDDMYANFIKNYHTHIGNQKTIIFCINKEHCRKTNEVLIEAGYKGNYITADTSEADRNLYMLKLEEGIYDYIINCMVLSEGLDAPYVRATVLFYLTLSKPKYFQSAARAGRLLPEDEGVPLNKRKKQFYTVLDMFDNSVRLFPIEHPFQVTLEPLKDSDKKGISPVRDCPSCGFLMPVQVRNCPECGLEMPIKPKSKKEIKEEIFVELDKKAIAVRPYLHLPKDKWNEIPSDLLHAFAKAKGYKSATGWVKYQLAARGEGRKIVKIKNYSGNDYHKWKNWLQKAYYDNIPIDAATWGSPVITDAELIFEYKLEPKESVL